MGDIIKILPELFSCTIPFGIENKKSVHISLGIQYIKINYRTRRIIPNQTILIQINLISGTYRGKRCRTTYLISWNPAPNIQNHSCNMHAFRRRNGIGRVVPICFTLVSDLSFSYWRPQQQQQFKVISLS
jgi:hypothetical protein